MKRLILVLFALGACFPLSGSISGRMEAPAYADTAASAQTLLDLVPASAILAIQVMDLNLRWAEIRSTEAIAHLQDAVLELVGIPVEDLPHIVGEEAVVFLTRAGRRLALTPIAVLRPPNPRQALAVLQRTDSLRCHLGRGALWIGPAEAEAFLSQCAREDSPGLTSVIPMDEISRRLPEGGLIRGWLNPRALADLARMASHETSTVPAQWLEAILAAEMAAVRFAGFRRELLHGEIVTDAVIVYDESRLPPAVFRFLDPGASPAIVPPGLPPDTMLAAAFRPEPAVWLPWIRYAASTDPRGPFRNLEFWLNEFQHRYRHDLARDLFGALGEHAWLLVAPDQESGKTEFAAVFELRETALFDAALTDCIAWLREMAWLESFGLMVPQYRREMREDRVVLTISLKAPSGRIEELTLEIADNHLIAATAAGIAKAASDWVNGSKQARGDYAAARQEHGMHGMLITAGPQLSRLLLSRSASLSDIRLSRLFDALFASLQEAAALTAGMRYENDAIRLHGRIRFGSHE